MAHPKGEPFLFNLLTLIDYLRISLEQNFIL